MTLTQARLLRSGFPEQYAYGYDPAIILEDGPSQRALDNWIRELPDTLERGAWLLLLGGVGCGKSMAMCRIAASFLDAMPHADVTFRTAREMYQDLLDWHNARYAIPIDMERTIKTQLLLMDDLDRWMTMSEHDIERGRALYQWDALMEMRNRPGRATVIVCNKTMAELQEREQFARWLDRARAGLVLEIPGASRRWEAAK